jgi:hypothetical protein
MQEGTQKTESEMKERTRNKVSDQDHKRFTWMAMRVDRWEHARGQLMLTWRDKDEEERVTLVPWVRRNDIYGNSDINMVLSLRKVLDEAMKVDASLRT